jgi:hypothetical protein
MKTPLWGIGGPWKPAQGGPRGGPNPPGTKIASWSAWPLGPKNPNQKLTFWLGVFFLPSPVDRPDRQKVLFFLNDEKRLAFCTGKSFKMTPEVKKTPKRALFSPKRNILPKMAQNGGSGTPPKGGPPEGVFGPFFGVKIEKISIFLQKDDKKPDPTHFSTFFALFKFFIKIINFNQKKLMIFTDFWRFLPFLLKFA